MKQSNKLAAAGVGLLIAAAASLAPAMASGGSDDANISSNKLDVTSLSSAAPETADSDAEEVVVGDPTAVSEEGTDAEDATELKIKPLNDVADTEAEVAETEDAESAVDSDLTSEDVIADEEEVAVETSKAAATDEVKSDESEPEVKSESEDVSEADQPSVGSIVPAPTEEETSEVAEVDDAAVEETEVTSPAPELESKPEVVVPVEEVSPSAAPVEEVKETKVAKPAVNKAPVDTAVADDFSIEAAGPAPKKAPVPVKIVPVTYVTPKVSLATAQSVNTVGAAQSAPTKQLGPVLLLDAVSEAPTTQGAVNLQPELVGAQTDNGQSMVVWFELPPAEGPALKPGDATTPLLGSAVTETAVSSNVIPAAQVAPQRAPAGATATASAAVPVANATATERGIMSRTLARTGSLAQYAAMLSAVAMIVGVGMLIGAAAARRKQER